MDPIRIQPPKSFISRVLKAGACILLPAFIGGCLASYGNYARDPEVFAAFNQDQAPLNYHYYYYRSGSFPIAVIGVEKKYSVPSKLWREVEPGTEKFKDLIKWIWEDYGYYRFAARINDPTGKQVGIMYTSIREVAIKFSDDNKIEVMLHAPWLWGPEAGFSGRYFGGTDANLFPADRHRASSCKLPSGHHTINFPTKIDSPVKSRIGERHCPFSEKGFDAGGVKNSKLFEALATSSWNFAAGVETPEGGHRSEPI